MLNRLFSQLNRRRLPQTNGRIYIPQGKDVVTVQRDKWGIPRISAKNRQDLFLAQGFVHAQDRLWQMEINRRAAKGELSAMLGPLPLETDRLVRILGFHRLAKAMWTKLDQQTQADLKAYTSGINAYLETNPSLPLEFRLLKFKPKPWTLEDSLAYGRLQMWALTQGATSELTQQMLNRMIGFEKASSMQIQYPKDNPATLDHTVAFGPLQTKTSSAPWTHPFLGKGTLDGAGRGSNGWVIAPQKSATGHAILCNDMHLPVGTPSLWYYIELKSDDGFHVTGFSQPGLPYVLVGHNQHMSWGATLSYTDCEDLFIERFHPENEHLYQFGNEFLEATFIEETIKIRGKQAHTEKVTFTHHGPLVSTLWETEEPIAFCSKALDPDATIDGFRQLNEATNWDEFVTAVSRITSPSLNLIYADIYDNIGHYVTGKVPIRAQGDGTVPALGYNGKNEWLGDIPFAEMPHSLNPESGFIVTANNKIIAEDYPYFLSKLWRNGYRAKRITDLIAAKEKISLADCGDIQMDTFCIPGKQLVMILDAFETAVPAAKNALHYLKIWDGYLTPDSISATVYELFYQQLTEALLAAHIEQDLLYQLLGKGFNPFLNPVTEFEGNWIVVLLSILEDETHWVWNGRSRQKLIEDTLVKTSTLLQKKLGKDPKNWQWGKLHQVTFAHALGIVPGLQHLFNQGPYPIGGDGNTVAQTSIHPDQPYNNNAISISSRHIVDLGNLANSKAMHVPGQSGVVTSPHYGDLIMPWLKGEFFAMSNKYDNSETKSDNILTLHPEISV